MLGSSWTKGTAFAYLCVRHWFGCLNRETVVLFSEIHRSEGLSPAHFTVASLRQLPTHVLVQNIDMCESTLLPCSTEEGTSSTVLALDHEE
jgi:hypothetical protein